MPQLALYTFGIFSRPADDPANDGFQLRNDPVLAMVDKAPGLIARSGYEDNPGPKSWGVQVYPRFCVEAGDGWCPSTLSVWQDMEHAMAFSYFGLHAEALSHGREWFRKPVWPPYAAWWIKDGDYPLWTEAVTRHEHLHDNGPAPYAFTFKMAFDDAGAAVKIDNKKVKRVAMGLANLPSA